MIFLFIYYVETYLQLNICHVEKLLHMTICHMEDFLHMTNFFSTHTPVVMVVTNIRYATTIHAHMYGIEKIIIIEIPQILLKFDSVAIKSSSLYWLKRISDDIQRKVVFTFKTDINHPKNNEGIFARLCAEHG